MSDTHLLQMALGLTPPWTVTGADFDPNARRLEHPEVSEFLCVRCVQSHPTIGCPTVGDG